LKVEGEVGFEIRPISFARKSYGLAVLVSGWKEQIESPWNPRL
jgi:hypothetical protein